MKMEVKDLQNQLMLLEHTHLKAVKSEHKVQSGYTGFTQGA